MTDDPVQKRVEQEIADLHSFLTDWLNGAMPASAANFAAGLEARLHPGFVNIQPSGELLRRDDLLRQIRAGYGASPDFKIKIRAVRLHHALDQASTILATYEEYQKGARNSARAENARLSSVLFEDRSDEGLIWRHIHETWLPDSNHDPVNFRF